jgi:hypothetical protein
MHSGIQKEGVQDNAPGAFSDVFLYYRLDIRIRKLQVCPCNAIIAATGMQFSMKGFCK